MNLFETLQARHSIRAFRREEVVPHELRAILEAANRAPSAGNVQAFELYVVRDRVTLQRLERAAIGQEFVAQAPLVLVFCANPERAAARYGRRGRELYALQDATIACAYAQLAATALGLSSTWVGAFDEDAVRKTIGADVSLRPVALLPVGHAAETPEVTPRRPLETLVHPVPDVGASLEPIAENVAL